MLSLLFLFLCAEAHQCDLFQFQIPPNAVSKAVVIAVNDENGHGFFIHHLRINSPTWFRYFLKPQNMTLLILIDKLSFTARNNRIDDVRSAIPSGELAEIAIFDDPVPDVIGLYFNGNGDLQYDGPRQPIPCARDANYIRGTRAYSNPNLFLIPELINVDVFVKLDFDLFFFNYFPFRITDMMDIRGAIVAHTGMMCGGDPVCNFNFQSTKKTALIRSHLSECSGDDEQWTHSDLFYSNLLFVSGELMRDDRVQSFFQEVYRSPFWFVSRWTDQIMWHQALLLTQEEPLSRLLDLTQYRCVPRDKITRKIPHMWDVVVDESRFRADCTGSVFQHKGWQQLWQMELSQPLPLNSKAECEE